MRPFFIETVNLRRSEKLFPVSNTRVIHRNAQAQ